MEEKSLVDFATVGAGREPSVAEFVSLMLFTAASIHVEHLNTRSYARHMALNKTYSGLEDLADSVGEVGAGEEGITFSQFTFSATQGDAEEKLTRIYNYGVRLLDTIDSPAVENVIQDVLSFCSQMLYLLDME